MDAAVEARIARLIAERRFPDALAEAVAALAEAPERPRLHDLAGRCAAELGRWDEAEAHYRKALALDGVSVEHRLNLANYLATSLRPADREEAKGLFLQVLEVAPEHFGAWSNLGKLLFEMGYASAARTAYTAAITYRPEEPLARINLGNILLHLHDLEAAREQFSAALEIDPGLSAAHKGLASLYQRLGQSERAARHRDQGFRDDPVTVLDYVGPDTPIELLVLASASGGNVPWEGLIDRSRFRATVVAVEYLAPEAPLPPHDLLFNAVGDVDLCPEALARAAALVARSTAPLINTPDAVRGTGRVDVSHRVSGLPGLVAPRTAQFSKAQLRGAGGMPLVQKAGFGFPLLLRVPGYHGGDFFSRAEQMEELAIALDELPGEELLAIEFLDGRGADGLYRKFRVLVLDGVLYPVHMALSAQWKVHYFGAGTVQGADYREEEARFLADFERYLGPEVIDALRRIAKVIGLDYFGIDFGVDTDGNVLLYEANATMTITPVTDDPNWDYRRAAIGRAYDAAHRLFVDRLADGKATLRR